MITAEWVYAEVDKTRRKWMEDNATAQHIHDRVTSWLDSSLREIALLYMGIRYEYGRVSLDTANNRQSSFRNEIEKDVESAAKQLFAKHREEILKTGLTPAEVQALHQYYDREVKIRLRDLVYRELQHDAERMVAVLLVPEREAMQEIINCKVGGDELAKGDINGTT